MAEDNNTRLLDIAADHKRVLNDPTGPYAARPDLREAAETRMAALLLRAGATPKVETAETVAQRTVDESFTLRTLHPNVAELIEQRTGEIAKLEKTVIDRMGAQLRAELGEEVYDQLCRDCGSALTPAVKADAYALKQIANHARYTARYEAAKPGTKR